MEIKKKVVETKEKAKAFWDEHKGSIILVGGTMFGLVSYGICMYIMGVQHTQYKMCGLYDIYRDMPKNVPYSVYQVKPDSSGLKHPWYFMCSVEDYIKLNEIYGAKNE